MNNNADKLSPEDDALIRALAPVFEALDEIRDDECSFCGETGDTFPCIECDVLVCGECGIGVRWCRKCGERLEE